MNSYSPQYLYDDFLGSSQFDNLKSNAESGPIFSTENNVLTDDGVYTGIMGANPMLSYENPTLPYDSDSANRSFNPETPSTQLPQELFDMVNSMLSDFKPDSHWNDNQQFDIDIAAASEILDDDDSLNEDIFGASSASPDVFQNTEGHVIEDRANLPVSPSATSRRRPRRKTRTQMSDYIYDETSACESFSSIGYDPQYPDPSELGVPSPASSSSGLSDTFGEDNTQKVRKRRPRVSYSTLTEEEKYKRIRDLNNEASRHYREKQRSMLSHLEQQLPGLLEKNKKLKDKAAGLQALKDHMKKFTDQFLREHIQNAGQRQPCFSDML